MQDVLEVMRRVLVQRFGVDVAEDLPADRELSSLGLDSLAFVEYAFELEGELKVTFSDIPRDFSTVGDFARFVHGEVLRNKAAAS